MYSKDQASAIKQAFWTAFGQYMALQTSSEGLKINWINYKTGIKHLFFKMQADHRSASVSIEINHPDAGVRELMFEQLREYKNILQSNLNEDWDWQAETQTEHYKTVSRISRQLPGHSIFKQEDWPALIRFFKSHIMALDEFWSTAQYGFELFK